MSFVSSPAPLGVEIAGRLKPSYERVLTPEAVAFVVELQRIDFDPVSKTWKPFVERGAAGSPSGGPAQDGP